MCYSRAADQWLASDLGEALQRFAKPWYRTRTLRVFRDTTSLSANPGLWTAIVKGIEQSEYFILLASPDAAASVWVDHEIRHWLASKPVSKLLIVVTDGDIRWDRQSNDFDGSSTTCIPRALFGALPEEPRWVDLRWAKGHDRLSLRTPRFRDAIADLAAPLHAVAKEELVGAEAAQFSRTRLIVRSAIITIAALASTTVIFAIQARQGPAGTGGSTAWAAAGVTFGIVAGLSLGGFVALWLYSLALPLLQTASGRARRQPGPEPPTGLPGRASSSEPPERRSIFISYRRTDEPHAAHRLYGFLVDEFGKENVFFDVDKIHAGMDFVHAIDSALLRSRVLLAVVGRNWVGKAGLLSPSRIRQLDDYVRIEVETALHGPDILVIPVLVGAGMPAARKLPKTLRTLVRLQAVDLRVDNFTTDCQRLVTAINQAFTTPGVTLAAGDSH